MKTRFALLLTLALSLPNFALADPAMTADSAKGKILTNPAGMSLYTFAMDKGGMSACSGPCATNWPTLAATASDKASGDWGILKRADGSLQWTYKGAPLYTFIQDKAKGDMTGDGVKGVWHLAHP